MTNYQSMLLNQMLDINWEIEVGDYNDVVMGALRERLAQLNQQMEDDMGREEWKAWKENGKRMFQPA
jgi:endonuclease/exonuclease/phosphatase (EEP) superfamily protein YafD